MRLIEFFPPDQNLRRGARETQPKVPAMYTGLTEPVDFDQTSGQERVEAEPASKGPRVARR